MIIRINCNERQFVARKFSRRGNDLHKDSPCHKGANSRGDLSLQLVPDRRLYKYTKAYRQAFIMSREGRAFLRPREYLDQSGEIFRGVWHSLSVLDPLCTSRRLVLLILSSGRRRAEALLITASSRANYTTARKSSSVLRHNVL